MQRPVMNPMFLHEGEVTTPSKPTLWARLRSLPHWIAKALLCDICFWQADRLKIEDGSAIKRIAMGMAYRLLFVPVILAGGVVALVWLGTHPPTAASALDPLTHGIHYDPVSFVSADGALLEAWFVPVVDSKVVLDQKDQVLRAKYPAVVLAHDYSASRHQMLPLIQPLHKAGYAVLAVALRGGNSIGAKGSAFGLREHADVEAAVELLRRRPGIDPDRIAVLGIGTGANAALLAAERDPKIAAVILDHPVTNIDQLIADRISPPQPWLQWLRPLCKWTFELGYGVDSEEMDLRRHQATLAARPVLVFDTPAEAARCFREGGLKQCQAFLAQHLPQPQSENPPAANVDLKELK
ncbi:MAG: alpha/beta hydrolase [Bacillota bacterium]